MYVPPAFRRELDDAWDIVQRAGAGVIVVATASGMRSVFAPVLADASAMTLRGHLARGNELWRLAADGDEVLASFTVADAYVSPGMYRSKPVNPALAPTWNYVTAEVRGSIRIHDDAATCEQIVRSLTHRFEESREEPWHVDDAPREYLDRLVRGIVGFEITVTSITAAAKLSQNKSDDDRSGIAEHLANGTRKERDVSDWMGRK